MAVPAGREHQALHMCEMMLRLGIEPGGGGVPRLSLAYATAILLVQKTVPRVARQNVGAGEVCLGLLPECRYLL